MRSRTACLSAVLLLSLLARAGEKVKRSHAMDYGPVLAHTYGAKDGNLTLKGLALRLGGEPATFMLFDTELLRMSAAWTGDFIDWRGIAFEGGMTYPSVKSDLLASTPVAPGWSSTNTFSDPRPHPEGPLPRDWGRYRGLYLHGKQVVLAYSVAGCDVLELPGSEQQGGQIVFTRTFKIAPSTLELSLQIAVLKNAQGRCAPFKESTGPPSAPAAKGVAAVLSLKDAHLSATLLGSADGARWDTSGGALRLHLPPSNQPRLFKVIFARSAPAALEPFAVGEAKDPAELTKGGPQRWPAAVTTKGQLGSGEGAYVVDTLTLPDDNPYKSWLRLGGFDFFADGKSAAVCTWNGDVWTVQGIDSKLEQLTWRRFATGLFQPLGLKIVGDKVYVTGRDQITRLHDLNNDGEADFYENFNNDCAISSNFHEFTMDLQTDAAGNFYYAKGQQYVDRPSLDQRQTPHNGTLLKLPPDGSRLEVVATGFRAPNGFGVRGDGAVAVGDNQGHWVPACPLFYPMPAGGYAGFPYSAQRSPIPPDGERPLCWLPYNIDNSPGGQTWVTSKTWGPFENTLLHTSYGKCTLFLVYTQSLAAGQQGGVIPFPLTFGSGIMRPRFNPADGQLYISGMRGWQSSANLDGGLYRVRYTGKPVDMPTSMSASSKGLEISFTDPVDKTSAADPENYGVQIFNVKRTENYGSPEYSLAEPTKKGRDDLTVEAVTVSEDGKRVLLEIAHLAPATNVIVEMKLKFASGQTLKHKVAGTLHEIPQPQTVAGSVAITEFKAPRSVVTGSTATLTWNTANATAVRLEPGIGKVGAKGSHVVTVNKASGFKLVAEGPGGPVSTWLRVETSQPRNAETLASAKPGLKVDYFELKNPDKLPDFKKLKPYKTEVLGTINVPLTGETFGTTGRTDEVGLVAAGYLKVPADGVYILHVNSDDGSALYVGDKKLVDNDLQHNMEESGASIALKAGYHPVRIEFFENGGGAGLVFSWEGPGIPKQVVPADVLFHKAD